VFLFFILIVSINDALAVHKTRRNHKIHPLNHTSKYDILLSQMNETPFHAAGLRFSCTRCSGCCRHDGGFVYLSEKDLARLTEGFGMDYAAFIETWCRWVPYVFGSERLSLREKANLDCVFWKDAASGGGCSVYETRPLQCRAFPFWDSVLCSPQAWKKMARECPGMDSGKLHTREEIDDWLGRLEDELVIERSVPRKGGG